jgi:hypothetical protein
MVHMQSPDTPEAPTTEGQETVVRTLIGHWTERCRICRNALTGVGAWRRFRSVATGLHSAGSSTSLVWIEDGVECLNHRPRAC